MASQIDPTIPVAGTPTTESVRNNFLTARNEISTLQDRTEGSPFLRLAGGRMSAPMYLFNDPTDAMMPATKGYVDANSGGGGPGGGGIPEAPATGQIFGRGDGAWQQVVRVAGETMVGPLILADDPDDPLGAATKRYVDALADAIIPEPPADNGAVFGRGDGEWLPVLPLTGGELSGSIGTIAIPTSPAPLNVNVFSNAFNAVSGIRLNAYQSAANTYNYLVPNATMPGAALLHLSGSGAVALRVAQGGAAGDPITPGPAVTFDYKGNLLLTGGSPIPTDGLNPTLSASEYAVPIGGHYAFNSYIAPGPAWKYLATGYAGNIQLDSQGRVVIGVLPAGVAGAGAAAGGLSFFFDQSGNFTAPGWIMAPGGNFGGAVVTGGAIAVGNINSDVGTIGGVTFPGGGAINSGGLLSFSNINGSIGVIGGVTFSGGGVVDATSIGASLINVPSSFAVNIGQFQLVQSASINPLNDNIWNNGIPGIAWFQVASYNFVQQSDPRLKEEPLLPPPPDALGKVCAIPVYQYRFTRDAHRLRHTGFDASEVLSVFPDGVMVGDDDAQTQAVVLGDMLALLWRAVQELSEKTT